MNLSLLKYTICLIMVIFVCRLNVGAQHIESYGMSSGGNITWGKFESNSFVEKKEQSAGFNASIFAIWESPTPGRLKTQLEFANKQYAFNTASYNQCPPCVTPRIIAPRSYSTEFNYISLLLAPMFDLSALHLNRFYILVGGKVDFILNAETEIQEDMDNETTWRRDITPERGNRFAYGGALGIGGTVFKISEQQISLELRYNFELSKSSSGAVGLEAQNRSLQAWIGVHF